MDMYQSKNGGNQIFLTHRERLNWQRNTIIWIDRIETTHFLDKTNIYYTSTAN